MDNWSNKMKETFQINSDTRSLVLDVSKVKVDLVPIEAEEDIYLLKVLIFLEFIKFLVDIGIIVISW